MIDLCGDPVKHSATSEDKNETGETGETGAPSPRSLERGVDVLGNSKSQRTVTPRSSERGDVPG